MTYQPVPIQTNAEADQQFLGRRLRRLHHRRLAASPPAARPTRIPSNYIILPEIISKEPLGPLVRQGDDQWADIVRWTLNALIAAEEYGVTSDNVDEMAKPRENPEIKRLLGVEGDLGAMLGLDAEWAKRAIMAGGNYGEIFAVNIGEGTPEQHRPRAERPVERRRAASSRRRSADRTMTGAPGPARPAFGSARAGRIRPDRRPRGWHDDHRGRCRTSSSA